MNKESLPEDNFCLSFRVRLGSCPMAPTPDPLFCVAKNLKKGFKPETLNKISST